MKRFLLSNQFDIIIVGGGYGGLSAGLYLQQCGYRTAILERTALPGGVSTPWRRKEFLFDGGTNWLAGSAPSNELHHMLAEIIDFEKLEFVHPDHFMQVEHGGEKLTIFDDPDAFEAEMLRISPEDEKVIKKFTGAIRERMGVAIPYKKPKSLFSIGETLAFPFANAGFLKSFLSWKGESVAHYASRFKSEALRQLFVRMFPHHSFFSMFAIISTFAWRALKSAGYPVGGSEKLLQVMIDKYEALGGDLRYRNEVASIDEENGVVTGVTLSAGEVLKAPKVIAAMDGKFTLERLLGGKFRHPGLEKLLAADTQTYPGLFQVSVGVNRTYTGLHHKYNIELDEKLKVGDTELCDDMMIRLCSEHDGLAPKDHTTFVVHVRIEDVAYWHTLRAEDRQRYRAEKQRVADAVIRNLEKRFGAFDPVIVDTASPATYIRYSNAHKASYQGWAPTPEMIGKELSMTIKELNGFYLAGQWVFPAGGITGVARVARHLTQMICHEDKRPFFAD